MAKMESAGYPGLYRRTSDNGKQGWYLYKSINGRPVKMKLGDCQDMTFEEARRQLAEVLSQLPTLGLAGVKRSRQPLICCATVGDVYKEYWNRHVSINNSRPKDHWRSFEIHWQPLASMPVEKLKPLDIQTWMARIKSKSGPGAADRQYNSLRACLRWGVKMQICTILANLFLPIKTYKNYKKQPSNRYVKRGTEYQKLLSTLEKHPSKRERDPGANTDIVHLLRCTGARKGNVLAMRWHEIDFEDKVWNIGRTKSGKKLTIPLASEALAILERRSKTAKGKWVFPAHSKSGHRENINKFWNKIREGAEIPDVKIHGLRHTVGSHMGLNRSSGFAIQRMLGHSSIQTTEQYTHLELEMIRQELEAALNIAAIAIKQTAQAS